MNLLHKVTSNQGEPYFARFKVERFMAYGRLDVYWANGDFRSFLLEQDNVSIGRSAGSTVILDTDTISRYHTRIRHADGHTFISDMDSANGTFLDGVQLEKDVEKEIFGGEEIQIGQLRIIFLRQDEQATTAIPSPLDAETQPYTREDHGFYVDLVVPPTGVPPGSHKSVEINLTNTSTDDQRYTVSITGLPHGWGRVNRPMLHVPAGETAQILLNIKPPRQSDSKPGDYPITVIVAHDDDPDKQVEAYGLIEILPYGAFAIALLTKRVTAYDRFGVVLYNQGSAPLPITMSATSPTDALIFDIPNPQRTLGAGERIEVKGEIRPKQRLLIGKPRDYKFDVIVQSNDPAHFLAALRGKYIAEPAFPPWSVYAMGGLALAIVSLLLFGLYLILQIDIKTPEILQFNAPQTQVMAGDVIALQWQAQDASHYSLQVNGRMIDEAIPAENNQITLNSADFNADMLNFTLSAHRGEKVDTANVQVVVIPPITPITFDISPEVLVRNVIMPISIMWQIDGATQAQLSGAEAIYRASNTPIDINPSYDAEAQLEFYGFVTDDFTLVLTASNAFGQTESWSFTVDTVDAVCTVTTPDFVLFAEPRLDAVELVSYDEQTHLIVDRIDTTRSWLRVVLDDGGYGWGIRQTMTCDDRFAPENLLIAVVTAVPTPSATPEGDTP